MRASSNSLSGKPFIKIFVLAGGASSRMGRNKAALKLGKTTFIQTIERTARRLALSVHVIERDNGPRRGPLSGILTAFEDFPCDAGLFLSCDMPFITSDTLVRLREQFEEHRCPVFSSSQGLAGFPFILPADASKEVKSLLALGCPSLQTLAEAVQARLINVPSPLPEEFLNVNTPSDFENAKEIWKRQEAELQATVLEIRGMTIRRGSVYLVRDFSWRIRKGEHWALLGPNGSGKTSFLNALLGYITPTSGDIFVLGEEYGESDWPTLRQRIGLVSSTIRQMMPEHEPAWITVASGKYAMIDFWGTPKRGDKVEAIRILKQIGCDYLADRPWLVLSQGERQKVLIGRALMARPALLILDEPCAGLDPAAREHFLQFLQRLGESENSPALVLVTHHVEEIMPAFTHLLLLKQGSKLTEGPVGNVLNSRNLSACFSCPIELTRSGPRYGLHVQGNAGTIV